MKINSMNPSRLIRLGCLILVAATLWASPTQVRAQDDEPLVKAVERAAPAVVNISTTQTVRRSMFADPFFREFFQDFMEFGPQHREQATNLGSGVIIDGKAGYILTNHHVVARADQIKVILANQEEYDAKLLGSDQTSDLAVLKIKTDKPLPTIDVGDSAKLRIGQRVAAIGNPFGLSHSVTTGVVSALNRVFKVEGEVYFGFIQTDAAINPGNSGGALLDYQGRLVGVNTAIYARAQGIGFAIPMAKAGRIAAELIKYGRVRRPWLGLSVQTLTRDLRDYFKTPRGRGVIVTRVEPGSPAAASGLKKDDVIIKVGSIDVSTRQAFDLVSSEYPPETTMKLTYHRQGKPVVAALTSTALPKDKAEELTIHRLGFGVEPVSQGIAARWGLDPGKGLTVKAIRPQSPADKIGLKQGDIVLALNDRETNDPDVFREIVLGLDPGRPVKMVVQRRDSRYLVRIRPQD